MNSFWSRAQTGRFLLGSRKDFRRTIVIPQAFVLVVLTAFGSIAGEGSEVLAVKLLGIGFALVASLGVDLLAIPFTGRLLLAELCTLCLILGGTSLALGLSLVRTLIIPLGCVLFSLLRLGMPSALTLFCCVPACLISLLMVLAALFGVTSAESADSVLWLAFPLTVVCALGLWDGRRIPPVISAEPIEDNYRLLQIGEVRSVTDPESALQEVRLLESAKRLLSLETTSALTLPLTLVMLLLASSVFGKLHFSHERNYSLVMVWGASCIVALVLLREIRRSKSKAIGSVRGWLSCFAVLILTQGMLPFFFGLMAARYAILTQGLLALAILSLPWGLLELIVLLLVACVYSFFILSPTSMAFLAEGFFILGLLYSARVGLQNSFSLKSRTLFAWLSGSAAQSASALTLTRLLAWTLAMISGSRSGLIVWSSGDHDVMGDSTAMPQSIDSRYVLGLYEQVESLGGGDGVLQVKRLGIQYHQILLTWFKSVPRSLSFFRLNAIVGGKEQRGYILVPVSPVARLVGVRRVYQTLLGLVSLVRGQLLATRSGFQSADVMYANQQAIMHREEDFNQLVHDINNIAQDISIQCEGMRTALEEPSEGSQTRIQQGLQVLEAATRRLASGVSDRKLLREVSRLGAYARKEQISVVDLLDELRIDVLSLRAPQAGVAEVEKMAASGLYLTVVSRDYLMSVLRSLLIVACRESAPGARLVCTASAQGPVVVLGILRKEPNKMLTVAQANGKELVTSAAANLARLSGGTFEDRGALGFELCLPLGSMGVQSAPVSGQWALFVDDNPEVTSFYGRIAEALRLPFASAPSVEAAVSLIEARGQPRLVISDIQLGATSGVELLKILRGKYGEDLRVIIVSGDTGSELQDQIQKAGGARFLAKPVGRRRLFAEIQAALAK